MTTASTLKTSGVIKGLVATAIVFLLFTNLQAISDMAPASIKNSDMPGLFGLPVAILSIGWFLVIPVWFVAVILVNAIKGYGFVFPRSFIVGAFAGLCIGFPMLQLVFPN